MHGWTYSEILPVLRYKTITAQRHFIATPTACWGLLSNLCFVRGKAQRHNGTNGQRSDLIVGRMHGWTQKLGNAYLA